MKHRLPPLNALRIFEAAARLASYRQAADELGLTPSAISHAVMTLEDWLGIKLFARDGRGIALTPSGRRYHRIVAAALSDLAEGSARLTARGRRRALSISAAPTFANRILLPMVARFRDRHPEIDISVDGRTGRVPVGPGGTDLAVRMGRGDWPGLTGHELVRETLVPVCAPALKPGFGRRPPLDRLPLIHLTSVTDDWAFWARANNLPEPDPQQGMRVDTVQMAIDAAVAGLGFAIGRLPIVTEEIRRGALVRAVRRELPCPTGYWLVWRKDRRLPPPAALFRDWLAAELTASATGASPPRSSRC